MGVQQKGSAMRRALLLYPHAESVYPQSLRDSPGGAYRPLPSVGSGVPAAAMFEEHLADADDAALMRLDMDQIFVMRTPTTRNMLMISL